MKREFALDLLKSDVNGDYFPANVIPEIAQEIQNMPITLNFDKSNVIGHVLDTAVDAEGKITITAEVSAALENSVEKTGIGYFVRRMSETDRGTEIQDFSILEVSVVDEDSDNC